MEKFPPGSQQGPDRIPTIPAAINDPESFNLLTDYVSQLEPGDRQSLLEALQAAEQYLNLEDERIDTKTVLKHFGLAGIGSSIGAVIAIAIFPPLAPAAIATAVGVGTSAGAIGLGARELKQKRLAISRIRLLRNTVSDAGRKAADPHQR